MLSLSSAYIRAAVPSPPSFLISISAVLQSAAAATLPSAFTASKSLSVSPPVDLMFISQKSFLS